MNAPRSQHPQKPQPSKPHQKELLWVLGTMVIIIAALIILPLTVRAFATFEYEGLTFTRERFDKLTVYHYSYYFNDAGGQLYQYNLYLRNDPRENTIPINSDIAFKERAPVYLTLNSTSLAACPSGLRDIATISQFLGDNLLNVRAGNIDFEIARENNISYVSCTTHPSDAVIAIIPGTTTEIYQNNSCHIISYASCDNVLPALEKFMVEALLDAKNA